MHSNGRQRISTRGFGRGWEFGFDFPLRVGGESIIQLQKQSHYPKRCSAPAPKFGPGNHLAIFHLLQPISPIDPPDAQHTFGLGFPALLVEKNLLAFFSLLLSFWVGHPVLTSDYASSSSV